MAVNLGNAQGTVGLDTSNLTENARKASQALSDLANASEQIGNSTDSVESATNKQAMAFAVAAKAVDEMVEAFKKAISVTVELAKNIVDIGSDFETAMAQVAATSGMSAKDVANNIQDYQNLANAAKEAGLTTMYSASEAAEALNYLALAGYTVDESIEYLPSSLTLAAAGAMDLGTASDMVTDAISALNLELDETDSFVDRMAKTAQSSNTSIEQLGRAILTVGGTAQVLAGGVTELDTALGVLANNGIKAAVGGTSLRQIIVNLTKPTKQAAGIIEDLGLKIYDVEGNMRPLNEIFGDLNEKMKDFSDKERMDVITHLFDARQLRTANALLKDSGEAWDELYDKIENADGAAEKMAETMRSNLNGALNIAKSNLESLAITIYEGVQKNITNLVNEAIPKFKELNETLASPGVQAKLNRMSKEIEEISLKLLDIAINAAPLLIEFVSNIKAHLTSLRQIIVAIIALNIGFHIKEIGAALSGLFKILATNPWAAVIVAVTTLATLFVELAAAEKSWHEAIIADMEAELDTYVEQRAQIEGIKEEWDDYKDTVEKTKEEENKHADEVQALYENYKELYEAGEDTTLALQALADEIPELNNMLAEGKTSFEDITQAVDDYCDSLIRAAELEASKDTYIQAVKTRSAMQDVLQTARQNMLDSERAWNKAQKELQDFKDKYDNNWLLYPIDQFNQLETAVTAAGNVYAENANAYSQALDTYNEANDAVIQSEAKYREAIKGELKANNEVFEDAATAQRESRQKQAKDYETASREAAEKQAKAKKEEAEKVLAVWDEYDKKIELREMTEAEKWQKVGDWFAANPDWDTDNEDLRKQYGKYCTYIEKGEEERRKTIEKEAEKNKKAAEQAAKEQEEARAKAVKEARSNIDAYKEEYEWDSATYAKALRQHLSLYSNYYKENADEWKKLQKDIAKAEKESIRERLTERADAEKEIVEQDKHRIEYEKKLYNWSDEEYNQELKNHLDNFSDYYDKYADKRKALQEDIALNDANIAKTQAEQAKKDADTYFKTWTDGYDKLLDSAQKAYTKLQSDRENFQNKWLKSVELYGNETKKVWSKVTHQYEDEKVFAVTSKSLKEQLKALEEFDKTMESLKNKNVGDDLLKEIWGMDPEKAAEFATALNKMSAGELSAYTSTFQSIHDKTAEMTDEYYKNELSKFEKDYIDPLNAYLTEHSEELSANMANIGEDTMQGYIDGLEAKGKNVDNSMGKYMDSAIQAAKDALGIASPSKEFKRLGEFTIDGFIDGIKAKIDSIATLFTSLGQTAGDSFVQSFKETWDKFMAMSGGLTVPMSMTTSMFGSTSGSISGATIAQGSDVSYGLTKEDISDAIKEAMPSGDVILTVDGVQFGRVSRDSLNLLAQQQGRLGLMS